MNSDMHNRLSARVSTVFCGVKRRQAFICAVGTQPCQGTECGASERAPEVDAHQSTDSVTAVE
jgi:hypothetical protein